MPGLYAPAEALSSTLYRKAKPALGQDKARPDSPSSVSIDPHPPRGFCRPRVTLFRRPRSQSARTEEIDERRQGEPTPLPPLGGVQVSNLLQMVFSMVGV